MSDGTAEGTQRIAEVLPGRRSSNPESFVQAGPFVFFTADDNFAGRELWAIAFEEAAQRDQRITN